MNKTVLYDQKRLKLLRRVWLFNWVPFIKKVYIAGSVALGNVHENSDFDVIVVTEPGRLYTCRFFCLLLFGLFGWRRTLENPKDGFCFNHFTTLNPITLNLEAFNSYPSDRWDRNKSGFRSYEKRLLQNLIEIPIKPFYYQYDRKVSRTLSWMVDLLERSLKRVQTYRIKKFLKKFPYNQNSRVIYDNQRVELCFNLKELFESSPSLREL